MMTTINSINPENILPDGDDHLIINGKMARKGSIAAFIANIEILENPQVHEQQKQAALAMIKTLVPVVIAVGLVKHVTFKNHEVEQMLLNFDHQS